jgi:hypothetical protein
VPRARETVAQAQPTAVTPAPADYDTTPSGRLLAFRNSPNRSRPVNTTFSTVTTEGARP